MNLAKSYSAGMAEPMPQIQMRKELAWEMTTNNLDDHGQEVEDDEEIQRSNMRRRAGDGQHESAKVPPFCGKWLGDRWRQVMTEHLQQTCRCGKRTREYCVCDRTTFRCRSCMLDHLLEVGAEI